MGGAERFTLDLCNELSSRGHNVTLIVTNSIKKYGHFVQFLDKHVNLMPINKKPGADPSLFFKLPKIISSLRPDIVHTHLGAIVYNILTPYMYPKAKFFHTIHNQADKEALTGGRISASIRKWLFKHKKFIPITISPESDLSFKEFYGSDIDSSVILNGCPYSNVCKDRAYEIIKHRESGDLILVNVARVMPQKNQIELVKAVEMVNLQGYNVHLFLVGTDDTHEASEIRQLKPIHTTLLGPRDNPRDYIAASDAFILSSIYEGMPLTLIEAFSTGSIPICTPVGGIKNMIQDEKNGLLTSGTKAEDLASAILRFLNLPKSKTERISHEAKLSYSKYSMTQCANNYLELFRK